MKFIYSLISFLALGFRFNAVENTGGGDNTPGVDFDNTAGESFVGLNLLNLGINQADGPFVVTKIEDKSFGEGSRKKMLPQVTATKGNTPYTMPIAASFQARLKEANLKPGDSFLIKRTEDYISNEGTEGCHSYLIKVTARATPAKGK